MSNALSRNEVNIHQSTKTERQLSMTDVSKETDDELLSVLLNVCSHWYNWRGHESDSIGEEEDR